MLSVVFQIIYTAFVLFSGIFVVRTVRGFWRHRHGFPGGRQQSADVSDTLQLSYRSYEVLLMCIFSFLLIAVLNATVSATPSIEFKYPIWDILFSAGAEEKKFLQGWVGMLWLILSVITFAVQYLTRISLSRQLRNGLLNAGNYSENEKRTRILTLKMCAGYVILLIWFAIVLVKIIQ
ncbi:hypothetical protein EGM51_12110 [Verrucomicrobia bacterium S94]|nr:hypothetical protein EGM51_12110 [Verrucomicrobia bacterium S94]